MSEKVEEAPTTVSIPFFTKLLRAAQLDSSLYEAIEHDPAALKHAAMAIILINICSAVGSIVYYIRVEEITITAGELPIISIIAGVAIVIALVKWLILTGIIYLVGVKIFKGTASFEEVLRTIAFAYAPVVLQILLPLFLGYEWVLLILLGTNLWMIVALVIAVRQSLDFTTGKAFGIVVLAGIVYFIISWLLFKNKEVHGG